MKKIVSKYSFNDSFTEKAMLSKTIPIRVVSGQGAILVDWNSRVQTSCFGDQGLTLPSLPQVAVRSSALLHKCLSCPWLILQFLLSSKEIYTVVKTARHSQLYEILTKCARKGEFLTLVPLLDVWEGTVCEIGGAILRHLKRIVDDQVLSHETQAPLVPVA